MTEISGRHAPGSWLLAPKSSNCEQRDSTSEPDFWPEGPRPAETSLLGRRIERQVNAALWGDEQLMCEILE